MGSFGEKTATRRGLRKGHIAVLGVVFFVMALLFSALIFYLTRLNMIDFVTPVAEIIIDTEIALDDGNWDFDDGDYEQADEIVFPDGEIIRHGNALNILLLGTDEHTADFSEDARADSIMLVSISRDTGDMKLVSIQRAMGVPVPGRSDDWLTHTFRYGGAPLTVQSVENAFLVAIDGYIRVNQKAFEEIINVIGGIEIELSELEAAALNDEIYTNAVTRSRVQQGPNHLDGYDTLQYSRLRYIDSDWHRIERQRIVMRKMFDGIKGMSITQALAFSERVLPFVQTSFSRMEITSMLTLFPKLAGGTIEEMSLPAQNTYHAAVNTEGRVLNIADFAKNSEILHAFIGE